MSGLIRLYEVWDGISYVDENYSTMYQPTYKITEDYLLEGADKAPEVDGKIVLAKITGPFFFGEGVSRNRRFYPRALWEKQLSNPVLKERLASKICLGTIGHDDGAVSEKDISEGRVSHIITNLTLRDDNVGIGEALILNTEAGRNIYTLFKAGSRIKVSSRAQGQFLEGQTHNGLPIVDPETYILEGFDWVLQPGFLETDPRLQESLQQVTYKANILESKDKLIFGTKSNTVITENQKGELKMDLQEALNEIRSSYKTMFEEQKKLREEAEDDKEKAEKEAEECKKELEECKRQLAEYQQIGEAVDIIQTLQEYAELGFSSPTEAQFILSQLQEEAEEKIDKEELEDVKKDIEEAAKMLAQYESLGSYEELKAIREKAEDLVDELDKKEEDEVTERLAAKYGLPESLVRKFVETAEDEEEAEKELEESLEGMADTTTDDKSGTDLEDHENDYELPNKVNDNDVDATPDVVEESLRKIAGSNRAPKNAMLEGYKAGSIVQSMFD